MSETFRGPARDWPEDVGHEDGQYLCRCPACHETFVGHKRRVACKACSWSPSCPTTATIAVGELGFPVTDEIGFNGVDYLLATPERRAAGDMLEALGRLEWSVRAAPYRFCPACRAVEPDAEFTPEGDLKVGHWPDCYLAAALRAAKGEASPDGDLHDLGG